MEFNIDQLKNKIQIIAYMAKTIPPAYKSKSILDLEALAILTALHSLQRYISNTKCYLLTDSRVLYYLFSQKVGDSSTKIRRWVLKLISDYPLITLKFIRTTSNLADYLTREGLLPGDLPKCNLNHLEITNFHSELPKEEFSLQEWMQFCNENPHYLSINQSPVESLNTMLTQTISNIERESRKWDFNTQPLLSLTSKIAVQNIQDLTTPLGILKERLSRENFIKNQKTDLKIIYDKCLQAENFTYTSEDNSSKYTLLLDLLMILEEEIWKIMVPRTLIGPLLAFIHLLGHMGTVKMLKNLDSYYYPNLYTIVRKFIGSCYGCFLNNSPNRKGKIGEYPIPNHPFEEISVDMAESLNKVGGFSHLLIVQCVLSDYLLIYPLRTKTAQEVCNILLYSVLQTFQVKSIHSDNGPAFRNQQWLKLLAAINIKVVNSSALNPSSRGKAERAVGQVKSMLKKMLTTSSSESLNWECLVYLVSKIYNNTITPRTNLTPHQIVFGKSENQENFWNLTTLVPVHHTVKKNQAFVKQMAADIQTMCNQAKENLLKLRTEAYDKINNKRMEKRFNKGDIVFVLDRYIIAGNPRPLKSKFHPSPFTVLKSFYTTVLVQRIADGFTTLYSSDDLKLYQKSDPLFQELPQPVQRVLLNDFSNFISEDFTTLMKFDPLDLPEGTQLTDTIQPTESDNSDIFNNKYFAQVQDEILKEENNQPLPVAPENEDIELDEPVIKPELPKITDIEQTKEPLLTIDKDPLEELLPTLNLPTIPEEEEGI
jgi:hypothetical protein